MKKNSIIIQTASEKQFKVSTGNLTKQDSSDAVFSHYTSH